MTTASIAYTVIPTVPASRPAPPSRRRDRSLSVPPARPRRARSSISGQLSYTGDLTVPTHPPGGVQPWLGSRVGLARYTGRCVADRCIHRATSAFVGVMLCVGLAGTDIVHRTAGVGSVRGSLRRCNGVAARSTVRPAPLRRRWFRVTRLRGPPPSANVRRRREHEHGSFWLRSPLVRWEPIDVAFTTTTPAAGGDCSGSPHARLARLRHASGTARRSTADAACSHRATSTFARAAIRASRVDADSVVRGVRQRREHERWFVMAPRVTDLGELDHRREAY
jgi:hypothetical protein